MAVCKCKYIHIGIKLLKPCNVPGEMQFAFMVGTNTQKVGQGIRSACPSWHDVVKPNTVNASRNNAAANVAILSTGSSQSITAPLLFTHGSKV